VKRCSLETSEGRREHRDPPDRSDPPGPRANRVRRVLPGPQAHRATWDRPVPPVLKDPPGPQAHRAQRVMQEQPVRWTQPIRLAWN